MGEGVVPVLGHRLSLRGVLGALLLPGSLIPVVLLAPTLVRAPVTLIGHLERAVEPAHVRVHHAPYEPPRYPIGAARLEVEALAPAAGVLTPRVGVSPVAEGGPQGASLRLPMAPAGGRLAGCRWRPPGGASLRLPMAAPGWASLRLPMAARGWASRGLPRAALGYGGVRRGGALVAALAAVSFAAPGPVPRPPTHRRSRMAIALAWPTRPAAAVIGVMPCASPAGCTGRECSPIPPPACASPGARARRGPLRSRATGSSATASSPGRPRGACTSSS